MKLQMNKLEQKIVELQQISMALEPSKQKRNDYFDQIKKYTNDFIDSLDTTKAYNQAKIDTGAFTIGKKNKELTEIIKTYENEVANKGINAASGKHLGYIPGGGIFSASLGDIMAAVNNEYEGMHFASPGGVAMERELSRWMASIFGYPETAIGNLTSGGSIANLIALTSARDKHKIKGRKIEKSVIYLSEQTHHCIQKALRIIGLEDIVIRKVKIDQQSKMITTDLSKHIENDMSLGLSPFLVVASAGTTDTGAIDPLEEIGEICTAHNLWFHVDAAYGGFFMLLDNKKQSFKGIELSDSLVVDPHKGLFLPYGIGAVLIKDREAVFHSHHQTANYMQDALQEGSPINPADVSPELTKHFRAMRMWLPLQLHGMEPFKACLEEKLYLTEYMRSNLSELGFSLGPEPDLSVSYFWYETNACESDKFNRKLLEFIHEDGSSFLSSTRVSERFVIRIAILSFRTKLKEADQALQMIENCLRKTEIFFKQMQM